jgi:hypothetical protein
MLVNQKDIATLVAERTQDANEAQQITDLLDLLRQTTELHARFLKMQKELRHIDELEGAFTEAENAVTDTQTFVGGLVQGFINYLITREVERRVFAEKETDSQNEAEKAE